MNSIRSMAVKDYKPHWLHSTQRLWPQSNCSIDLWVEVLHTLNLNPIASFAFTLAADFEGDQWTLFKVPSHDLFLLYGIDVQELNIWDSLLEHISVQTRRNRLVLVEVDAFYLPDVSDTNYHQEHEKTTIGIQAIDPQAQQLNYFHNSGYYTLHADDFAGIFHNESQQLSPYAEFVKLDTLKRLTDDELAELAAQLLHIHLTHRPATNPFIAYRQYFEHYIASIEQQDLAFFHKHAFATTRQYGASYEYAAFFLRWLADYQGDHLRIAAKHLENISSTAQVFLLKTARTVRTKKPFACSPLLDTMESEWNQAMELLCPLG
jgi:Domain of unknown function (DUF1839)